MKNKSKTVQAVVEKNDFSEYDKTKATPQSLTPEQRESLISLFANFFK